jgi:O-antigen/teichoic acid export membrane protein
VFLGAKWESAIAPLRWLCAYGVARAVLVLLPPALVAAGRIRQEIVFNALCFVALPLAFVGGVRAGPWGVAAAWALVYPALALVWLLPRALAAAGMGLTAYLRPLVRPLAAAGIMVAVVMAIGQALPSPGPLRLAVRVGAGVLAYLGCVRVMEGAVFGELRALLADARRGMKP